MHLCAREEKRKPDAVLCLPCRKMDYCEKAGEGNALSKVEAEPAIAASSRVNHDDSSSSSVGECPRTRTLEELGRANSTNKGMTITDTNNAMAVDSNEDDAHDALNLSSHHHQQQQQHHPQLHNHSNTFSHLSAKMRLKKHRLLLEQTSLKMDVEHEASLLLAMKNNVSLGNATKTPPSNNHEEHSALHRLAEAAERKQEEELMEVVESESPSSQIQSGKPAVSSNGGGDALMQQQHFSRGYLKTTPSPDSAIHSACYSPSHSPVQQYHRSSLSQQSSLKTTASSSLSRNNSDASQHSVSSAATSPSHFSPSESPVQTRHKAPQHYSYPSSPAQAHKYSVLSAEYSQGLIRQNVDHDEKAPADEYLAIANSQAQAAGISRQQLINSPCPICGDKISGFHYGIFSCESCKGFFKRTVQNKKNYVCLRGAQCQVSIATRKKCPACRFDKCLKTGMKLEAIREDRTRGGRSTYQCSYTLPASLLSSQGEASMTTPPATGGYSSLPSQLVLPSSQDHLLQRSQSMRSPQKPKIVERTWSRGASPPLAEKPETIPPLLQEIMDVEHLWFSSKPLNSEVAESSSSNSSETSERLQTLTIMADKRLYKLVKWCKSLPLFKNIHIDDQIALLINAWCELLVFSCCYRSMSTPGQIRVSNEKSLDIKSAATYGVEKCIEKMLNFTEQLRRLRVDYYEYVSLKVIILLTSDASGLKEPDHVRDSQEKVVRALQHYTYSNYPSMPSKFGDLLLRMPELHRVCQVGKEMLCPREDSNSDFNLLMELLRGDH